MGQSNSPKLIDKKTIGGFSSLGISTSVFKEKYPYNPVIAGILLHFPITKPNRKLNFSLNSLPHFAIVDFAKQSEFEFGVTLILELSIKTDKNSSIGINVGSGPHYISVETNRQAQGFIFSDMLFLNYKKQVHKSIFGIVCGLRHISNAGLKEPNSGINNLSVGFVILKFIKPTVSEKSTALNSQSSF